MNKYYTAFYFKNFTARPDGFAYHCTHKYLGEQSDEKIIEIQKLIFRYFQWKAPPTPNQMIFDFLDYFNEQSVVLCTDQKDPLNDLREALGEFAKDEFTPYRPHITVLAKGNKKFQGRTLQVPLGLMPVEYRLVRSPEQKVATYLFINP